MLFSNYVRTYKMSNIRKQANGKPTKAYSSWLGIKQRIRENVDGVLCSEFQKFEDYHDWYTSQKGYDISGWRLHKKVFDKNNNVYSPETLCFLPQILTSAIQVNKAARGKYPIGVYHNIKTGCIQAFMSYGKNQSVCLGSFNNAIDAFKVYKKEKERYVHSVANEYKHMLDQRAYIALMNYTVEITD